MKFKFLTLLTAVLFAALPSFSQTNSDTLTVYSPNGNVYSQVSAAEGTEGNGQTLFFIGDFTLADPAQFGNATTLCESMPCNPNSDPSQFSDIFGVARVTINGQDFFFLSFTSDGENGTAFGNAGAHFLLEANGGPFDATMYLNPRYRNQGYTATFTSDNESTVPEPSSLLMVGSGILGVAAVARRKFRS